MQVLQFDGTEWIPAPDVELKVGVRRLSSLLPVGEEETYTLVYPENMDMSQGKVSILAPIGTAMLGYRVGDVFEWEVPAGNRRLKVEKLLYQPEDSGDFDL